MSGLTRTQRAALQLLAHAREPITGPEVARLLYDELRTPQGAHQTCASLIRHGLAEKDRDRYGHVRYRITDAGRAELNS